MTPETHVLSNGIRVVTEPVPGAKSLVLAFRFTFGAKDDPGDRLGLTSIAEDALFKGTPARDARQVFDAFDSLGIRRGSSAAVEYVEFRAQLLPRLLEETAELYHECFRNASFPQDQVEVAKTLNLEELKRLEDNPIHHVLFLTYQSALGDPLGRIPLGTPESVPSIGAADVRDHWSRHCHPSGLLIAVAGGLERDEMVATLEKVFGGWSESFDYEDEILDLSVAARTVHHEKRSEQENIGMLFPAAPRGHEMYYPAQAAVSVLSGSASSRLFTEVREKRGLAYNVSASYRARRGGGLIVLYAGTTAERAQETLDVCRKEIADVGDSLTDDELERAKSIIKGRLFTIGDLPEGRAGSLMDDLFLLGEPRSIQQIGEGVEAVTVDDVKAYLQAFPADPLTLVTLGPKPLEVS